MTVAYDGGAYLGWQKTPKGPSIEERLQDCIERILQQKVQLQAASRTDAGVHALGQVVNFFTDNEAVDLLKFQRSLNRLLPKDIIIKEIREALPGFHPTLDNVGKEYLYQVCYGPHQFPCNRHYSWHFYHPLNFELLEKASNLFVGKHDFAAFCNSIQTCHYENTTREVSKMEIRQTGENTFQFIIIGQNFLYKMVRNLVGTVLYVGAGKLPIEQIPELLKLRDRTSAGMTAPAHGLTLHRVFY